MQNVVNKFDVNIESTYSKYKRLPSFNFNALKYSLYFSAPDEESECRDLLPACVKISPAHECCKLDFFGKICQYSCNWCGK